MALTEKQQRVFRFIRSEIQRRGLAPSYEEIRRHFGFRSLRSVQKYLDQLERQGMIRRGAPNEKRSIRVLPEAGRTLTLSLAGTVAAGAPIEAVEELESVEVPADMLGGGEYFALRVRGRSMIDEGIFDGDIIVVRRQKTAQNGQTVVALIDGEATVKKYYRREERVELRPANATMTSIWVDNGDFEIRGVVVGLMRRYT